MPGFHFYASGVLIPLVNIVYFRKHTTRHLSFLLTFSAVYPETMGVPLEEMDAVFGEGMNSRFLVLSPPFTLSSQTPAKRRKRTNRSVPPLSRLTRARAGGGV